LLMSEEQIKKAREIDLKVVFGDILNGYTEISSDILDENPHYIKHLNIFDTVQTDKLYDRCYIKAKTMGLPTEEEQVKYLNKEELWTSKNEAELEDSRLFVSNLRMTKSKLFLKSQINPILKEIESGEEKTRKLLQEKINLMGYTAESYANKRSNEIYIQQAIFKDKAFKTLSIDEDKFNHITDSQLKELTTDYNDSTEFLTLDNIKKISLLPFFCNYFYLCEDSPMIFYGKPVVDLSFFQAELFAFGRYFKNLVQESKAQPPEEIKNDPDKLMDFYEMRRNAEEVMEKLEKRTGESAGASSLVGATSEDLEAMGYKKGAGKTLSLSDVASKKGGNLDMKDFMDLHE